MFSHSIYKGVHERWRDPIVEEINKPIPYSFTRLRPMRTQAIKRKRSPAQIQQQRQDAIKRRKTNRQIQPSQVGFLQQTGFYGRYSGINAEQKFFDTALNWTIDSTAEVVPGGGQLNLIPQGVTESTRIGRKCNIKKISIKLRMSYQPAAAAEASGLTCIVLVLDKQCNGAAATVSGATGVYTSTPIWEQFLNLANSGRFVILKKWMHSWNSTAGVSTAYNPINKHMAWNKKCDIPLEFSSTTGALTEIRSNNLFLIAQSTPGLDDLVSCTGVCRLRFSDGA